MVGTFWVLTFLCLTQNFRLKSHRIIFWDENYTSYNIYGGSPLPLKSYKTVHLLHVNNFTDHIYTQNLVSVDLGVSSDHLHLFISTIRLWSETDTYIWLRKPQTFFRNRYLLVCCFLKQIQTSFCSSVFSICIFCKYTRQYFVMVSEFCYQCGLSTVPVSCYCEWLTSNENQLRSCIIK